MRAMNYSTSWHQSIKEIPREEWDRLAQPLAYPFLEWQWLAALERSRCLGGETGWFPRHLCLRQKDRIVAIAPLFLKEHSWGEFVFDQEWANLSYRLGVPYYPKLIGMSPFTPANGYRFLWGSGEDGREPCRLLLGAIDDFCADQGLAVCQFLHVDESWKTLMTSLGMSEWLHHSLIWENRDYPSFEHFLRTLKSRQRKNIKRERRLLRERGLIFRIDRGHQAPAGHFRRIYDFYASTCLKFRNWSRYLNQAFFLDLERHLADRLLLITAFQREEPDRPVAMSFFVQKADRLYGRYWGCRAEYEFLHFETCYYQAIEWAIEHGIRFFDAGSGRAEHKRRRGFPARANFSLHRHYQPVLKTLWDQNIERINHLERGLIRQINGPDEAPCSTGGGGTALPPREEPR